MPSPTPPPSRQSRTPVVCGLALALALLFAWAIAWRFAATQTAVLHLGYLPVLIAAFWLGPAGGFVFALITGVLLGPGLMVGQTYGWEPPTADWLLRTLALSIIGSAAGAMFTEMRARARQLAQAALIDPVTKLPNRPALLSHLHDMLSVNTATTPVGCLVLTFPEHGRVMRHFGIEEADRLFMAVIQRLRDAAPELPLFVLGTNHIAAITLGGLDSILAYQKRLSDALASPIEVGGHNIQVEPRVGAATADHDDTPATLSRKPVIALEAAGGRVGPLALYNPQLDAAHRDAYALAVDFRQALRDGAGLALSYQPKIDVRTGACTGVEALLRWTHPVRGAVPPGKIMPLVEGTSVMQDLTRWVILRALKDLPTLSARTPGIQIAVNVSTYNLEEPGFADFVVEALSQAGIGPGRLQIEITESEIMRNPKMARATLDRLREAGVELAIDDFGTGHSSLAYLDTLPVNELKIDRSFIQALGDGPSASVIVRVATTIAHRLGVRVVAEGVETAEVLKKLGVWRVDHAQGFHIGKPMPLNDFSAWLGSREVS